jgi:hypothetical protein
VRSIPQNPRHTGQQAWNTFGTLLGLRTKPSVASGHRSKVSFESSGTASTVETSAVMASAWSLEQPT